jgi:hypothetical protein
MKYQLVLKFPKSEAADFDWVADMTTRLNNISDESYLFDGHDLRSGEINLYIHTDDPKKALAKTLKAIPPHVSDQFKAAFRLIEGEDYTVIWPERSGRKFERI